MRAKILARRKVDASDLYVATELACQGNVRSPRRHIAIRVVDDYGVSCAEVPPCDSEAPSSGLERVLARCEGQARELYLQNPDEIFRALSMSAVVSTYLIDSFVITICKVLMEERRFPGCRWPHKQDKVELARLFWKKVQWHLSSGDYQRYLCCSVSFTRIRQGRRQLTTILTSAFVIHLLVDLRLPP